MKLGRHVEHDPRSRNFPARKAEALSTVTHRHYGGSLDQGNLGSCTGNALAHARNTVPLRHARPLLTETDAVKIYSLGTQLDGVSGQYPPEDTGSTGLGVCKAGVKLGYITSYHHAFGLDEALHALMLQPVIVGTNWYESMFDPNSSGFVKVNGDVVGGHEYCIVGLNVEQRYVKCVNSWGNEWGLDGRFRLTFDQLDRLLQEDGDVTVPIADKPSSSLLSIIKGFFGC